jgi:hypothetical protein
MRHLASKTAFMFEDKETLPHADGMAAALVSAAGSFGF